MIQRANGKASQLKAGNDFINRPETLNIRVPFGEFKKIEIVGSK
jgi:hypothetical protein